ncbi:hypothetical protein IHE45_15G113500 [Dioscorea alata]|uniref:Uncharacterized protein n=1 Tax=Dioscorea alata TaxID=55571 RepID=A0ACB7UP21_DIOAL|nr:hypothetical protein IHE45_15G113500 [Dioscorea alata]
MEKSISKTVFSREEGTAISEESGWTWYFEDFLASEKRGKPHEQEDDDHDHLDHDEDDNYSNFVYGSSMVSDAASYAAWKPSRSCKKLSFKKRKARGVLDDDSLEDTASSPANSPKVSDLNHRVMVQRKPLEYKDISDPEKKEVGNGEDETNEFAAFDGRTNNCTELKKRGLCLVPLSMFVDYLDK